MIVCLLRRQGARLASDAGIAIGPILFIISVLGILAAAIAAGSGSFSTGTASEGNRAKAAALIDIGQSLKIGFDRVLGNDVEFSKIVIDPDNTSDAEDLFSPTGGGISPPSITMGADTTSDVWHYPLIAIPKLGTSAGSRVAVLQVTKGVCDELNQKIAALTPGTIIAGTTPDLGDFADETNVNTASAWPLSLQGKMLGCVYNADDTTIDAGYYFYQVLGVQ